MSDETQDALWERFSELYEKAEGVKPHPRDKYHKHHFELFKMGCDAGKARCVEAVGKEKRHHQDMASNLNRRGVDARYLDELAAVGICAHLEDLLRAL
jgi:hypothetical protein